jgi:hypothetical protein
MVVRRVRGRYKIEPSIPPHITTSDLDVVAYLARTTNTLSSAYE